MEGWRVRGVYSGTSGGKIIMGEILFLVGKKKGGWWYW